MNTRLQWLGILFCCLAALVSSAALAQDDDSEEERGWGSIYGEIETWVAIAAGLEYEPATRIVPNDPLATRVLRPDHGTESEERFRIGYELTDNRGSLIVTWYSHEEDVALADRSPNDFVFGQTLSFPSLAGFANDGLADGFTSFGSTSLRDFRLDFYRTAFKSDRIEGRWFIGVRRIQHERELRATYLALNPLLPALIPPFVPQPRPDLNPQPETAFQSSMFKGRGLGGGMDVYMPLLQNKKLMLEAGFSLGVLRGKMDSAYRSTNFFYVLSDASGTTVLTPPYDEFDQDGPGGTPLVNSITQQSTVVGFQTTSRSTSGQVLEGYFGVRWRALQRLDVFAGFRSAFYDNVGVDLRPIEGSASSVGVNTQQFSETDRSATYEGFYGGIGFRF